MTIHVPATPAEWGTFLRDYSSKFLANSSWLRALEENGAGRYVTDHVGRQGWIGYEPAGMDAVVAAEERLGIRLPSTYRNFLLASNGFGYVDEVNLLNVNEIGWFPERDPDLVHVWVFDVDEGYRELLERSLLVAKDNGGPGVCWLLRRDDAAEDSEWTAYEWFTGDSAPDEDEPYDSFGALLVDAVGRLDAGVDRTE